MKRELKPFQKKVIGWREWCALPDLQIPAIKVKSDTGAATSALHAVRIKPYIKNGKDFVRFETHPIQKDWHTSVTCNAELVDQLHVTSSAGHREERYVIKTPIILGQQQWDIKLTLTSRETMGFRMLLGREAMKGRLLVDPELSYQAGVQARSDILALYRRMTED